jgi:twitching motility two-component system response regulator PilH
MAEARQVVIADPDPEIRTRIARIIAEAAGNAGHSIEIHEADDGFTAQALVQSHRPDLVVTEVLLEGHSGFSILRSLRELKRDTMPVFIFVTEFAHEVDRYWGLRSGAGAYVMKPFEDEVLQDRVSRFFEEGPGALEGLSFDEESGD